MIVIDASVAIKLLNQDEEYSNLAQSLYKRHVEGSEKIIVPQFLFIEVANYLATRSSSSEESIKTGLQLLFQSNLSIHYITPEETVEAALFAKKCKTSVYDMLY